MVHYLVQHRNRIQPESKGNFMELKNYKALAEITDPYQHPVPITLKQYSGSLIPTKPHVPFPSILKTKGSVPVKNVIKCPKVNVGFNFMPDSIILIRAFAYLYNLAWVVWILS